MTADWEQRLAHTWSQLDELEPAEFRHRVDRLVAEYPGRDGVPDFERACAFDSTGHPDRAVPLYRQALRTGLTGLRRRRAVIQLASSLRNLGEARQSVLLLTTELEAAADELDDAVRAVLALALVDVGRGREAVGYAVGALAPHLPRYQRSMAAYARRLRENGVR